MAKRYRIDIIVNSQAAEMAARRSSDAFAGVEKAADKAADAAERATKKAARTTEKMAEQAARAAERRARSLDALQDRYLKKEYDDRVAIEARKLKAQEKSAARVKALLTDEEVASRVADQRIAASNKARTQAAMQAANVQWQGVRKNLTDEEIARKVLTQKIINSNEERIKSAMKLAGVEYKGNKNGWEGVDRLMTSVTSLAAGYVSLQTGVQVFTAIGDAAREAAASQKSMTDDFLRYRDAQREVQAMLGRNANSQNALESAKFEAQVGMTPGQGDAYNKAILGSGAQHRGGKLSEEEFDKFSVESAKLAMALGADPATMGDFAGVVAGSRDYEEEAKAKGVPASQLALRDLHLQMRVMMKGKGDNATNAKQLSMLSSFAMNPDETLGTFTSGKDAAIAASVAAEINPAELEVFVRSAIKGVRDFDGKAGPLLKRAGVGKDTGFREAFEKLAPVVMAETRKEGGTMDDTLKKYFTDERVRKAMGGYIAKGVGTDGKGGAFQDREEEAARYAGLDSAGKTILASETAQGSAMVHNKAVARNTLAKLQRGELASSGATLAEDAEARLRDRHEETSGFTDKLYDMSVGAIGRAAGGMTSLEIRKVREMRAIVGERARKQGVKLAPTVPGMTHGPSGETLIGTEQQRDQFFRARDQEFAAQGGNMLVDLTKQQVELNRKLLDEQRKANATNARVPLPVGARVGAGMGRP